MKVICIKNPGDISSIKIGGSYEVLSNEPEVSGFFLIKAEDGIGYYLRHWFEDISIKRDRIITEILKK
jgi:hypothetical protein